jgi:hypothetical protein
VLTERVEQLEGRLGEAEAQQQLQDSSENVGQDRANPGALKKIAEDLQELRQKLHEIEVNFGNRQHVASVEIAADLVARVEDLEAKEKESREKMDNLLGANEDIANTFIAIKDDFKQTQSLTQKIHGMKIEQFATSDCSESDNFKRDVMNNFLEMDVKVEEQGKFIALLDTNVAALNEKSNQMMEDVVKHEIDVKEIRKDMKTDQNLIIIRFNTHKDTVEKTMEKVQQKVTLIEATQHDEVIYQ